MQLGSALLGAQEQWEPNRAVSGVRSGTRVRDGDESAPERLELREQEGVRCSSELGARCGSCELRADGAAFLRDAWSGRCSLALALLELSARANLHCAESGLGAFVGEELRGSCCFTEGLQLFLHLLGCRVRIWQFVAIKVFWRQPNTAELPNPSGPPGTTQSILVDLPGAAASQPLRHHQSNALLCSRPR